MQLETVINKLIRFLNNRLDSLSINITSGGVDSMEKYKYIIGQINAFEATKQEISNLLEDKEQKMKLREQSSTSDRKIIMPNNDLVGVKKSEKKSEEKEETKLPKPTGWRLLVLPFKMKKKTKGGVILAENTLERQQVASQVGLVLAMGPQCYKDKERYPEGPWCKVNDWVMFARYAGSRVKIEGGEIRMLNDDEVLATIDSPEDILHEF
jgi:chaperonin GroES